MAQWSKQSVDPSDINNGNEFTPNDDLSVTELNAIVNNSFYAIDKVDDSSDKIEHLVSSVDNTDANNVGIASMTLVDYTENGKTYKKFKASNLKGEQGIQGEKGDAGIAALPVGMIFTSPFERTESEYHLLDGSILQGTGIYEDFVIYMKQLYNKSPRPNIFTTEAEWQSGKKGKFVYNSTEDTIRLPDLSDRFILGGTSEDIGEVGGESSHNHILSENGYAMIGREMYRNAIRVVGLGIEKYAGFSRSYKFDTNAIQENASEGWGINPAILNGSTDTTSTLPPYVKEYYYIVVGTKINTDDITVNINNIVTDLNNKANKNFSNLDSIDIKSLQLKCNFERFEIIYSKKSNNANINWGYTSGILNGNIISNKDFSKYRYLKVYCARFGCTYTGIIDFSHVSTDNDYRGTAITGSTPSSTNTYITLSRFKVDIQKTTFTYEFVYQNNEIQNNSNYYIYKIEGFY